MEAARSCMETPVVQPCPSRSTVMVKGVSWMEVLLETCISRSSSRQRSLVMGTQSTPRPRVSMKLTFPASICWAAMMKSPSFSRSSSSTRMTNFPAFKSSMAFSMDCNLDSCISNIAIFLKLAKIHKIRETPDRNFSDRVETPRTTVDAGSAHRQGNSILGAIDGGIGRREVKTSGHKRPVTVICVA